MLAFINISSLIILISSLIFAIVSKRIDLPSWYEVIAWIFVFGAIGAFLNGIQDPPLVEAFAVEIILRSLGSLLVLGAVIEKYKRGKKNEANKSQL